MVAELACVTLYHCDAGCVPGGAMRLAGASLQLRMDAVFKSTILEKLYAYRLERDTLRRKLALLPERTGIPLLLIALLLLLPLNQCLSRWAMCTTLFTSANATSYCPDVSDLDAKSMAEMKEHLVVTEERVAELEGQSKQSPIFWFVLIVTATDNKFFRLSELLC